MPNRVVTASKAATRKMARDEFPELIRCRDKSEFRQCFREVEAKTCWIGLNDDENSLVAWPGTQEQMDHDCDERYTIYTNAPQTDQELDDEFDNEITPRRRPR